MNRLFNVTSSFRLRRLLPSCLAVLVLGLTACKRVTETMEITEEREISSHNPPPVYPVTSAKRFFDEQPAAADPHGAAPQGSPFTWSTPPGWKEIPPSAAPGAMRLIDLRFGPNDEGECYLSVMPGQAGGLDANVNRWRTQMGQPVYTAEELAQLPKKIFLGRETVFVRFDGDFKGVGAEEAAKSYRLLGLVMPAPEMTLFVKLTGPKDLVAANEAAFDQFCQSVSIKR